VWIFVLRQLDLPAAFLIVAEQILVFRLKRWCGNCRPCRKGKRVRFYSTVDLINMLEREKRDGKASRLTHHCYIVETGNTASSTAALLPKAASRGT
jgi:NADH:ubiquinone oxidoreductase subunit F (NADH-binding)